MVNISNDLLEVRTADHTLGASCTLSFENTNGDLEITEWENSFIRVETSIYGDSSRGVPEDLSIVAQEGDNRLSYSVYYPGSFSFCSVDFAVFVPEGSSLFVISTTVNGETVIKAGVDVLAESVNGDIDLEVSSSRGVSTTNGDISAALLNQNEPLYIESENGDISLELPENMGVVTETVNGDVFLPGGLTTVRGTSENTVTVQTVNGDINVVRLN